MKKIWERFLWILTGKTPEERKQSVNGAVGYGNKHVSSATEDEWEKLLLMHPVMQELREWIEYNIKVIDITDPIKKRMTKYYMTLFLEKVRDAIITAVHHNDEYGNDIVALNNLLIGTITDVRNEAAVYGVPDIFLDKFTHYLYTQIKILDATYKDIESYEHRDNPIERTASRLDLAFLIIRIVTSELESVVNGMNGELQQALEGSVFDE